MADPTNPTLTVPAEIAAQGPAAVDAYTNIANASKNLADTQRSNLGVMDLVNKAFSVMHDVAKGPGVSLDNLSALTDQQIEKFGDLATATIAARESFAGFAGVDYSGVANFGDHLQNIKEALDSGGTAAMTAAKAVDDMATKYLSAGVKTETINKAKKAGINISKALLGTLTAEGQGIIQHADNMNRARVAYIQMAGKTGELGDVIKSAGKDFKDLDTIMERQKETIHAVGQATGLTDAQTEKWYNQLGLIPGALNSNVNIIDKTGKRMSMLTAVIQIQAGTGREQADIMQDLKVAFKDYGLEGEKAALFSVRMSDVSTRLKAPIEDVTTALRGSADAFKMFATGQESASKSAESLAVTLNKYGKALESTGLSASQSVEAVGQVFAQVSHLSLGQQAFISQQSGGPGGLMGAAREQLKTPGEQVEDAMSTLKRQFGTIMTVKDAAQSEAAASQWVKQTAMLQTLLGPLAKDQQSANRLLEAMKNRGEGQKGAIAQALKPTAVQDAAKRGEALQAKSNTILSDISHTLDAMRNIADISAGRQMGRISAGATPMVRGEAEGTLATHLANRARAAQARSGAMTAETTKGLTTGKVKETTGMDLASDVHTTLSSAQDVLTTGRAIWDTAKGMFVNKGTSAADAPAQRVGAAAQRAVAARPQETGTGGAATHQGPGAHPAGAPQTVNIVGKFTIDCPHCGRPSDVSDQANIFPQQYNR